MKRQQKPGLTGLTLVAPKKIENKQPVNIENYDPVAEVKKLNPITVKEPIKPYILAKAPKENKLDASVDSDVTEDAKVVDTDTKSKPNTKNTSKSPAKPQASANKKK